MLQLFTQHECICVSKGAHDDGDTMETVAKLKHEVRLVTVVLKVKL